MNVALESTGLWVIPKKSGECLARSVPKISIGRIEKFTTISILKNEENPFNIKCFVTAETWEKPWLSYF